jgi:esterase FrsA
VRATAYDDPPLEPVAVPFDGRDGEGAEVRFHLSRPPGAGRAPVVLMWGGIDTWKEEAYSRGRPLLEAGVAVVFMDMPGVGEAPVLAGRDAESQWTPVFDWVAGRDDLDETRCAVWGTSPSSPSGRSARATPRRT